MSNTYRIESHREWARPGELTPTTDDLRLGCLQRIADATELMARRYNDLLEDAQREKRRREEAEQRAYRRLCQIRALKGVITKLGKQVR